MGKMIRIYKTESGEWLRMVLIADGKSKYVAHALKKIGIFEEKKAICATVLDLIKCLKLILITEIAPHVRTYF